jgi:transposase
MIGLDLAKSVFQVHGVDAAGQVVIRRRLRRGQVLEVFAKLAPCVVGMEACSGAHYWARELRALGHEVRLMPPSYVKPYVKRNKTDGRDAEAICEAMQRPTMRFVAVKSIDQQAEMALHRSRALMVRQRTMAANALRGLFAEFGMVAAQGINGLRSLVQQLPTPAGIRRRPVGRWCASPGIGRRLRRTFKPWSARSLRRCATTSRGAGSCRSPAWVRSLPVRS